MGQQIVLQLSNGCKLLQPYQQPFLNGCNCYQPILTSPLTQSLIGPLLIVTCKHIHVHMCMFILLFKPDYMPIILSYLCSSVGDICSIGSPLPTLLTNSHPSQGPVINYGDGGCYKMGEYQILNFLRHPLRQVKTFCAPL